MANFKVHIKCESFYSLNIEADSPKEAFHKAEEEFYDNKLQYCKSTFGELLETSVHEATEPIGGYGKLVYDDENASEEDEE